MWTTSITAFGVAFAFATMVPDLVTPVPKLQPQTEKLVAVSARDGGRHEVVFDAEDAPFVVSDRAVLMGSPGTVVAVSEEGGLSLTPKSGQLALHVGSRPVDLVLGKRRLQVKSLQLRAALAEGVWLVTIDATFKGAGLASVAQAADAAGEKVPAPCLRQGRSYWIEGEGFVPENDPSVVDIVSADVTFGPFAPRRARSISAVDIESPRLLAPPLARGADEMPEIELEPVEVEAGCVEICVE